MRKVHPTCKSWSLPAEDRTVLAEVEEMIKSNLGSALVIGRELVGSDSDPINLARNPVSDRISSCTPNSDYRVILPVSDRSHAIVSAETTRVVRVGVMGTFVDEDSHR